MPSHSRQVIVVGAGISGLACAYRLHQLGISVALFESSAHAGGLIGTVERDGFLFESGPQSFQGAPALLRLISELGLDSELLRADPRAPRYVLRDRRLHKVPMSPQAMLTSGFLSIGSRWRVASEPFRRTKPPSAEESVADFVRRKFGREILEYLVSPFVSGVYAGDPETLSLSAAFPSLDRWEREHGSILRGAMKSRPANPERKGPPPLCSFRSGISALPRAIASALGQGFRPCAAVSSLHRASSGREIETRVGGATPALAAGAVVLATPAYSASRLLASIAPSLARILSGIAYAPVAVVAAGYRARQIGGILDGFGFLIPRSERLRTLGAVWNSSLFARRAPQGSFAITSFLGGATDPTIIDMPDAQVAAIAHRENSGALQILGEPVAGAVWKHPKALPQYNLGHAHAIESLRDAARQTPGIFLTGNYLEGPSIGKCVEHGFSTAETVREFLADAAG